MTSKYWSIHEAARYLSVPPPTLRRWAQTGAVQVRRLSGAGGHRRIPYDELIRLGQELGQPELPPRPSLQPETMYRLEEAAEYLGVSARFLWNQGLSLSQAGQVTGSDIVGWEDLLYRDDSPENDGLSDERGGERMSHHGMHGQGPMGAFGAHEGPGWGPYGWGFDWDDTRPHSILWLRSMKRHLEVRKADLEDKLSWVEEELQRVKARQDQD